MPKLLLLILILYSSYSFSTQQIQEIFIIEGVEERIDSIPLETLFTFDEIHLMLGTEGACSGNWRGYKATWELKNGELFINSFVKGACSANPPSIDPMLFFGEKKYPIKAKWFSDKIEVRLSDNTYTRCISPEGKRITTGHSYEAMVYEFSTGDFIYKSKQTISHLWEPNKTKC